MYCHYIVRVHFLFSESKVLLWRPDRLLSRLATFVLNRMLVQVLLSRLQVIVSFTRSRGTGTTCDLRARYFCDAIAHGQYVLNVRATCEHLSARGLA